MARNGSRRINGSDRAGPRMLRRRTLGAIVIATVAVWTVSGLAVATTPPAEPEPTTTLAPTPEPAEPPAPTAAPTTAAEPTEPSTTAATAIAPTTAETTTTALATTTAAPAATASPPVYSANAECNPATAQTTVTWRVTNTGTTPLPIVSSSEGVSLEPNPVPPGASATATRVLDGPASDQQVTSTLTVEIDGQQVPLTDLVFANVCQGPALPPEVSFTFTKTPSATTAAVGDTIEYVYCGQNNSTIPLEVVRFADDRLGVVAEGQLVVGPGETVCNTDIGPSITYEVQADDAGAPIYNEAIVTVQTQETERRVYQQAADTAVDVPVLVAQPQVKVDICHANQGGGYVGLQDSASALVEGSGHNRDDHQDGRDVIPPGPWDSDGRNWNAEIDDELQDWIAGNCRGDPPTPTEPTVPPTEPTVPPTEPTAPDTTTETTAPDTTTETTAPDTTTETTAPDTTTETTAPDTTTETTAPDTTTETTCRWRPSRR